MRLVNPTGMIVKRIGDTEAIRMLKRVGFDALDRSFFEMKNGEGPFCTDNWKDYALAIKAEADQNGISFSQAHAPFPSSNGEEPFDTEIVERIVRSMEVCAILGVKDIVVHPKQHLTYAAHAQELFEQNVAFYKELLPHAERLNVRICTENMWQRDHLRGCIVPSVCGDPKEFCALVDAVDSPYLAACLDVGHCALTGFDIPDFIHALGKDRLKALHIHDVDYRSDTHTLPFQQMLPWEEIMAALADIGYEGDLTFEANNFVKNLPVELIEPACAFMAQTGRYLISRFEAHR